MGKTDAVDIARLHQQRGEERGAFDKLRRRTLRCRTRGQCPKQIAHLRYAVAQQGFGGIKGTGHLIKFDQSFDRGQQQGDLPRGQRPLPGRFYILQVRLYRGTKDAFGHTQLGGVAPLVANMVREHLGYKYHWAVADYLQRAARHIASKVDVAQAYAVGKAAVEFALAGQNAVMPAIVRKSSKPYKWTIKAVPLADVANVEKKVPRNFITADGFGITEACRRYLEPLIAGEDYPPYRNGLPDYVKVKGVSVKRKLTTSYKL